MKMLVFGKNCGSFTNEQGESIEFFKVSAVKLAQYVDQKNDGLNISVGGECAKYSVTRSVFADLPDNLEDYDGGLMIDVDFDDKKRIVSIDLV